MHAYRASIELKGHRTYPTSHSVQAWLELMPPSRETAFDYHPHKRQCGNGSNQTGGGEGGG